MSESNLNTYSNSNVVKWYENLNDIVSIEKHIFELYNNVISQANVLDIGIGGGRTTNFLIKKCKSYIGIDYSMVFVKAVKIKFPNKDIRCMDARNLQILESNSFDFINFSFNGIDYVDLNGRKQILSEIWRVLKPGGIFFFSTHNKSHTTFNKPAWVNSENSLWTNFKTFFKLMPFYPVHLKQKNKEIINVDYAIINDCAHNYSLFTFYTTPDFLRKQLAEFCFSEIDLFSKTSKIDNYENLDDWIFVTCKKSLS